MIAWIGTAAILAGRLLLAHELMAAGFAAALAGSACWCWYAWGTRQWALLVVDGVMLAADGYGLLRNLG